MEVRSLVFFILMVGSAALTLFFCYKLHKATKGAIKGWSFLVGFGVSNSILSILGIVRNIIGSNLGTADLWSTALQLTLFLQMICICAIAYYLLSAIASLSEDFGLAGKILNKKNLLWLAGIIFIVLLLINISNYELTTFSQRLYSISVFMLGITATIATILSVKLMFATKRAPWYWFAVGSFLMGFGLVLATYSGNCCEPHGVLSTIGQSCIGYSGIFLSFMPAFCIPSMIGIYWPGLYMTLIGTLFATVAYGLFWNKLARVDPEVAK